MFHVVYVDGDSEDLFLEEIEEFLLPKDLTLDHEVFEKVREKEKTPKKRKNKKKLYVSLPNKHTMFLLLDVETTGSKRNWDVVVSWGWIPVYASTNPCTLIPGSITDPILHPNPDREPNPTYELIEKSCFIFLTCCDHVRFKIGLVVSPRGRPISTGS